MATADDDPVKRAGMVAIFASWQRAAFELAFQAEVRDSAAKRADEATAAISACREACKAFGVDVNDGAQFSRAIDTYLKDAAKIYNDTRPGHLPVWHLPPPAPMEPEQASQEQIPPPSLSLETPPPPQMPRMKDAILEYLSFMHDLELGGSKASAIREFIETKYVTTFHEKTVGMTLYRLLKDGKVSRKGHLWFFVPQGDAATKNPGVSAPGSVEGR